MLLLIAAEEAESASNPILPWSSELFWGALSFGILYFLVRYVLLPPVQKIREEREETILNDRKAADAARAKASSAASEVDDQLAGVRAEAAELIEDARVEAETERKRLMAWAEREVNAMMEEADGEIAREREEAMVAIRPQVADLAIDAASRVTGRSIDPGNARPIVDRVLNS